MAVCGELGEQATYMCSVQIDPTLWSTMGVYLQHVDGIQRSVG